MDWAGGARPVRLAGSRDLAARMAEVAPTQSSASAAIRLAHGDYWPHARVYRRQRGLNRLPAAVLEERHLSTSFDDPEQPRDT